MRGPCSAKARTKVIDLGVRLPSASGGETVPFHSDDDAATFGSALLYPWRRPMTGVSVGPVPHREESIVSTSSGSAATTLGKLMYVGPVPDLPWVSSRNRKAIALIQSWASSGSAEEQGSTLEYLRSALAVDHSSERDPFG